MDKVNVERNPIYETLPEEEDILTMPKAERLQKAALEFLTTGDKVHLVEQKYLLEYRDIERYIASNPKECNRLLAKALRQNLNKEIAIISSAQDILLNKLVDVRDGNAHASVKDLGLLLSSNSKTIEAMAKGLALLGEMEGVKVNPELEENEPKRLEDYIDGKLDN